MDKLSFFGLAITCFGIPITIVSFAVFSHTGLFAFGLACTILGGTILLTPWNPIPEPPVKGMMEGSCLNIEALLEEFNAEEKAIYLPPEEGGVYSYSPLASNPEPSSLKDVMKAPRRIVTDAGGGPGLLIFPPGSELIKHSGIDQDVGLEAALDYVLVDFVELVESLQVIDRGEVIEIVLNNPRIDTEFSRFRRVLGSLPVSVAGSVIAFSLNSPVKFEGEDFEESEITARFRVVFDSG